MSPPWRISAYRKIFFRFCFNFRRIIVSELGHGLIVGNFWTTRNRFLSFSLTTPFFIRWIIDEDFVMDPDRTFLNCLVSFFALKKLQSSSLLQNTRYNVENCVSMKRFSAIFHTVINGYGFGPKYGPSSNWFRTFEIHISKIHVTFLWNQSCQN